MIILTYSPIKPLHAEPWKYHNVGSILWSTHELTFMVHCIGISYHHSSDIVHIQLHYVPQYSSMS